MPSLHRLGLVLRTTRHLRLRQAVGQLARRLRGPARVPLHTHAEGIDGLAPAPLVRAPSVEGQPAPNGGVILFGRPSHDPRHQGWDGPYTLWSYTLHYHGWLGHPEISVDQARATIESWIAEHRHGMGWEPYPVSMRTLHWLGWLHRHGGALDHAARARILGSLAAQLEHLATNLETHLDGNHLWTNLVALTTAGAALRGPLPQRLLERFGPRLVAAVHDQLAGDGVHGERTPTYHCLLAEQLAVLLPFARVRCPPLAQALAPALHAMVEALPAFTHPDGDVALWGDSQRDAPVTPARLAAALGRSLPAGHADAPISGFHRRCWGPWTLLWNRGDVGLPHQAGHIHGDALSVELSLGTARLLVDAGVGTYEVGPARRYARSTAAHNTVSVGTIDQHELWASHRIGDRGRGQTLACAEHRLVGRVRGYAGHLHRRTIEHRVGTILITDVLETPGPPAQVRYFLPRSLPVHVDGEVVTLQVGDRRCTLRAPGLRWHRSAAPGWRGIEQPAPRTCLVLPVHPRGTRVELRLLDDRAR